MPEMPRRPEAPRAPPPAADYSRGGGATAKPPAAPGRYDSMARRGPRPPSAPPSAAARAAQQGGVPSVAPDARAILSFIARWKLEQSRAKLLLARLAPTRRRDVMDNFRATSKDMSPTAELEKYIATRVPLSTTSSTGSGTKRPLGTSGSTAEPPSKRLRESPAIGAAAVKRDAPPPSSSRSVSSGPSRSIRSPLPSRGSAGGGSRSAPPPWRGSSAPPPSIGARRPAAVGSAARAKESTGPSSRPSSQTSRGVLGASGAKDTAKPGDLIKSLLG